MIYETYKGQIDLFSLPRLLVTKKVRLIELFSGIGAQAKAMDRLGVHYEKYRVCEFDKYAVDAYNAIHGTSFEPSDICEWKGEDLGIVDKDRFTYLLTYSFPCQDLSIAGRQAGMNRGEQTRSGLLWQVERLLRETKELPDILIMENVKNILSERHKPMFNLWKETLVELGYTNCFQILNAKDFGVPQNRERCFMVSWLGEYDFQFPTPIPLTLRLKDLLEEEVDEKYYLTDEQVASFVRTSEKHKSKGNGFLFDPIDLDRHTHTQSQQGIEDRPTPMVIETKCKVVGTLDGAGFEKMFEEIRRVYDPDGISPAVTAKRGGYHEVKIINANKKGYEEAADGDFVNLQRPTSSTRRGRVGKQIAQTLQCTDTNGVCVNEPMPFEDLRIRKLTPREYWRLMDFDDEDFDKASVIESNTQLYKQAGNSIVVNCLVAIFGQLFEGKENAYKEKYRETNRC